MPEAYDYICTKCGVEFTIGHYVDPEAAVCTPCFRYITAATSADDYYQRLNPIKRDGAPAALPARK